MSYKILPIKVPPIITYQFHAFPLSVLLCYEDAHPWIHSNYIQLYCNKNLHKNINDFFVDFYLPEQIMGTGDYIVNIPFFHVKCLDKDILDTFNVDVNTFIINCLNQNYYVMTVVDEYYIDYSYHYKKTHLLHDILIHGYSDENACFYTSGFNKHTQYKIDHILDFMSFKKSFENNANKLGKMSDLTLFKYQPDPLRKYTFDLHNVIDLLEDYLHSKNTSNRYRMYYNPIERGFGLDVYHYFIHYLQALIDCKTFKNVDKRAFHCLWEHKKSMLSRIEYMQKHGYLHDDDILSTYQEIEKKCLQYRNKILKYHFTHHKKIIKDIVLSLSNTLEKEYEVLNHLLNSIK